MGMKTEDTFMVGLERGQCTLAVSALTSRWFAQVNLIHANQIWLVASQSPSKTTPLWNIDGRNPSMDFARVDTWQVLEYAANDSFHIDLNAIPPFMSCKYEMKRQKIKTTPLCLVGIDWVPIPSHCLMWLNVKTMLMYEYRGSVTQNVSLRPGEQVTENSLRILDNKTSSQMLRAEWKPPPSEVCGPYVVTLNRISTLFEWYMARNVIWQGL